MRTLLLCLICCTAIAQTETPTWITNKPADANYYIGIGSASKKINDYAGAAKKNALQDLVSEIRINISSTSILHQIDKNYQFKEEYESNIKTIAAAEIQDFERVATYEDANTQWVYYRLAKATYQAQKQKSLSDVKVMALQFFEKAVAAERDNSIATAIDFYFRTLLTLKDYWGDNIEVAYQGKPLFLAIESYARLQQLLDLINIRPAANTVRLQGGTARLQLTIANRTQSLPKIPVILQSSSARAQASSYVSDEKGEVMLLFAASNWNNTAREADVLLDLKSFSRASADERFYDYLIRSLRVPTAKLAIESVATARQQPIGDYFPFYNGLVMADFSNAEKYSFKNLRVVPIRMKENYKEAVGNMGYYLSLHQAMLNNQIVITESGVGGSVNTLIGRNLSADTLFIMSGEILQGGKQDRVVGRDMLIPPGEGRVKIPVFCVEKGRWKYKGESNDQKFSEYYGMANEHLRDLIDHKKGQQDVWEEVSKSNKRDGVNSGTDAYTDHANNRTFRRAEQEYIDFFQRMFDNDETVIGVLTITGNRVEGVDLFINNILFRQEFPKLLYSYIDEAVTYGAPIAVSQRAMEEYINALLDPNQQATFIEQRGQAFIKGQQVIHVSTY
ncbi:MAG: ARPP-1 family domain-containing protein [Flammeovirgaceae bacterium]